GKRYRIFRTCLKSYQSAASGKISSCTSLKSLADAMASPKFLTSFRIKFAPFRSMIEIEDS
ncbi:MAG: hypothetical protein KDC44_00370, partial [Phaeodactylibacter sp.]|nr:hypothetical protein [Phaeodactylibacter sp.]